MDKVRENQDGRRTRLESSVNYGPEKPVRLINWRESANLHIKTVYLIAHLHSPKHSELTYKTNIQYFFLSKTLFSQGGPFYSLMAGTQTGPGNTNYNNKNSITHSYKIEFKKLG